MAIAKSKEAKFSTCFSGILRRLLCIGGLPTHPADQVIESNEVCEAEMTIPGGVVARLMGLESFPNLLTTTRNRTLGSYLRSRSVNSIDFSNQLDPTKNLLHYRHRRVRTSVSFRELGLGQLNTEREEQVKVDKEKSQPNDDVVKNCGVGNVACKNGNKTRVNSVIEIKKVDCLATLTGGPNYVKKKRSLGHKSTVVTEMSRSRKPMSSRIADSQSDAHFDDGATKALIRGKSGGRKMKNEGRCSYKRMVETVCSVTKQELEENWNLYEFEEICQQFGQEILQVLLKQSIDELLLIGYAS